MAVGETTSLLATQRHELRMELGSESDSTYQAGGVDAAEAFSTGSLHSLLREAHTQAASSGEGLFRG